MKCFVVLKNQWHAQPVAQPPVAAGEEALAPESALALVLAEAVSLAAAAVPATAAGADVPPEPPLKSVAYQPEPLS
jgi:hypothetical protein